MTFIVPYSNYISPSTFPFPIGWVKEINTFHISFVSLEMDFCELKTNWQTFIINALNGDYELLTIPHSREV